MKYIPPSVSETAFNCAHCGALAKQNWFTIHADPMKKDSVPNIISSDSIKDYDLSIFKEEEERTHFLNWVEKAAKGYPFFDKNNGYRSFDVNNAWFSRCYNCNDISFWLYDRLIYPKKGEAPPPNNDLPDEIRQDYNEASSILDLSPRGAAALIRLSIQKLCKELGQPGKNINADISALVSSGLDVRVQRALDAVRVIGNNAVHPGQIDLKDDRKTAESLFRLMNLIAEKMISEPKHVDEVYALLPDSAKAAIKKRDQ
jgi:hypothetical protein